MVWESFRDISYYDMFAVRKITERAFNQAIHVHTEEEADFLVMSLNELEKLKSHNNEYAAALKTIDEYCDHLEKDYQFKTYYKWLKMRLNSQK